MIRVLIIIMIMMVSVLMGCRTTAEKRVKKDIAGINEQLYEIERSQIKDRREREGLKKEVRDLKEKNKEKKLKHTEEELKKIYKDGYRNYLERNYSKAIEILGKLTGKYTDDVLVDNALYWQAESYSQLNDTEKALQYYQLVYSFFPFSNKADYALYKIGNIYMSQKNETGARLAYSKLTRDYPDSDLYKATLIKLRNINKKKTRRR